MNDVVLAIVLTVVIFIICYIVILIKGDSTDTTRRSKDDIIYGSNRNIKS